MRKLSRSGAAVVEFAVILPLLLLLLCGLWVMGRQIQVHQVLDWATREAARVAAQGQIISETNDFVNITVQVSTPSIKSTVEDYLIANGIDTTGLEVEFENFGDPDGSPPRAAPAAPHEPYQAQKGDRLRVTVRLPHDNVRLPVITRLPSWALPNPAFLTSVVDIDSVTDDPFEIVETLPGWNP